MSSPDAAKSMIGSRVPLSIQRTMKTIQTEAERKAGDNPQSHVPPFKNMTVNKCRIHMQTVVVDQFTGIVGKSGTGKQQDETVYRISFTLTLPIAESMKGVEARPSPLRRTTQAVCDEKPSC